jgi:hypothetical protein
MKKALQEYFKQIHSNPEESLIEEFNQSKKTKLYYKEVFPCFFTGDINLKNKYVTISLNPKYDEGKEKEQGTDFDDWLDKCEILPPALGCKYLCMLLYKV